MTSLWLWLIISSMLAWETRQAPANKQDSISATTSTMAVEITQQADVREKRNIEVPPPEILRFMRRFGYLEANPSDSESLYHESAIIEAIKNVQKYGALNQTGELDNQTLELFNKPRCGVPDIEGTPYYLTSSTQRSYMQSIRDRRSESREGSDFRMRRKRFVVGAPTWKKRRLRYHISNWSRKIPKFQVERDIARALELWARYSGLRFERVNNTDADIIIYFGTRYHGDNFPFDGPGNILAHAFYPYEMGSWGGDVHFDEDENWKENSTDLATGVDFFAVAAHEIGHSLGLAHSPHYNSIMFPYYKGPGAGTTLDYDDTLAMYTIYLTKVLEDDVNVVITPEEPQITVTTPRVQEEKKERSTQTKKSTMPTFRDDYETVRQHKNRFAGSTTKLTELSSSTSSTDLPPIPTLPTLWPKPELSKLPNICLGKFDAVSVLNGTVHVFKNEYVYKLTPRYTVMNGYPLSIYEMFPFLPADVKHIDAAYERYDGAGVFFTGDKYWVFSYAKSNKRPTLIDNSPLPLENLIDYVPQIDAVMLWPKNNLTYLFAGERFWRYNDHLKMLDVGYPKPMRRWRGIPGHIDAAATLNNGKTYFFKDNLYWLYDNANVRPMRGYPRRASSAWLHCVATTRRTLRNYNTTVTFIAPSSALT